MRLFLSKLIIRRLFWKSLIRITNHYMLNSHRTGRNLWILYLHSFPRELCLNTSKKVGVRVIYYNCWIKSLLCMIHWFCSRMWVDCIRDLQVFRKHCSSSTWYQVRLRVNIELNGKIKVNEYLWLLPKFIRLSAMIIQHYL